jgi:surface antigen
MKDFVGFVLVVLVVTVASFAQSTEITRSETLLNSEQKSEKLVRPARFKNLRQYTEKYLQGKFDEESLLETQAEGRNAITFSLTRGGRTIDAILIDRGDSLELNTDEYPSDLNAESKPDDTVSTVEYQESEKEIELLRTSVPTCAGVASPGNVYKCCDRYGNLVDPYLGTGLGNCVYYSWEAMRRFWGLRAPHWSHAKYWFDRARAAGYPTTSAPGLYAIGVNSTDAPGLCGGLPCGHVALAMELSNSMVLVYEQVCGSTSTGIRQKWHAVSKFNKGWIRNPLSAPIPQISGHSPQFQIWSSPYTQAVRFNTYNVNPGARAVVTFPSGGRSTLKDSQLYLSGSTQQALTAYMVLNARGWWKIEVYNESGKSTGQYSFWVN